MTSPDIAVVVLDTLRADRFRRDFDWIPGRRFTRAYSTSHWTVPAHGSLLTGRYASEVGVTSKSRSLDCPDTTLFELLSEAGYNTRMWSSNLQIYQPDGWERGVDEHIGPQTLNPEYEDVFDWVGAAADAPDEGIRRYLDPLVSCLRSDKSKLKSLRAGVRVFQTAEKMMDDNPVESVTRRLEQSQIESPTFLLANLMDVHAPYWPGEEYRVTDEPVTMGFADTFRGTTPDRETFTAAYDSCSRFLGDRYRKLFEMLTERFDYVITCSDHGELLGEYGMYTHPYGLYEELVHVPIVVSGTGIETSTCDVPISLLDVFETIRSLAEVGEPRRGQSLLGRIEPQSYMTEYHGFLPWARDNLKEYGATDVYDAMDSPLSGIVVPDGRYGWETHTQSGFTGDHRLREILQEQRATLDARDTTGGADEEVSDSVRARLEELGYA